MKSDPLRARRDGPTRSANSGDCHSGEGLASLRAGLERTNANTELRTADRQAEQSTEAGPAPVPGANEKSPTAKQRG